MGIGVRLESGTPQKSGLCYLVNKFYKIIQVGSPLLNVCNLITHVFVANKKVT